ncbi:cyclic AMP receptor-like protein A isoform X2 [Mastacembelus armatus]|uniref:cyclic AMP receptor-like protein A isoform X2 n=1 Tax=Mastacembelus armatus TaxID=205130 RepID=UPI000E460A89|nr:cyclic AMP receptor-like protein A isoform X2 [Mastacembelus armatus]
MRGDSNSKTSHRNFLFIRMKMILSLTVAAFFDSIAYVMGESHREGRLCDFQAWWLTYFDWSALAWVCLITLNLYLNLVREISTNKFEMLYHLMAWGVPLVMASLPLLKGYYGPAGAWCWITDDHVAWRFGIVRILQVRLDSCSRQLTRIDGSPPHSHLLLCTSSSKTHSPLQSSTRGKARTRLWYVPLFSLIFLMICCYARIICVANERMQSWLGTFNPERERRKVSLAEEIKPLKWYPSVYLLVSIFPLINRLHNAFYPQDPSFSLTLLHVLSAPLHGLANAFVFGLDRDWWSLLSPTGVQLALQSRLCDRTRIGEYHPGAVRYTQADLVDLSDDDDDDTNVLFYSPDMTLKDRGP